MKNAKPLIRIVNLLGAKKAKFEGILHMLSPKLGTKLSGGYLLTGKQIRNSDLAQQVNLNSSDD